MNIKFFTIDKFISNRFLQVLFLVVVMFVITIVSANAQTIDAETLAVDENIGGITNFITMFIFIANAFKWLGWSGVVIGVVIIIALLIYKLIGSDDTEAMKKVQAGITKAIIIVILGLLLVGAGFLVSSLVTFFGAGDQASFGITEPDGGGEEE